MVRIVRTALAICTVIHVLALVAAAPALGQDQAANLSRYERSRIQWGATTLTLTAQIHYQMALSRSAEGDYDAAIGHLERAIVLDPRFPDAYFTMSRIEFRRFDANALFHFVGGVKAVFKNFHAQGLLAINVALNLALLVAMVGMILCVAFAIRYLPFAAYPLADFLDNRLNAAAPRTTAVLLALVPFVLFPGFVTGFCILMVMTWQFMHRRERATMVAIVVPFVALAGFAPQINRLAVIADPDSFVSLATESMTDAASGQLIAHVNETPASGLEVEKHNVLGLLNLRQENFDVAASHFLKAISLAPSDPTAYVNLGNVYYIQGMYEKALEGYRKADRLAPNDPVGQYNLAQAYIKTLLLAESSKALKKASETGIERFRQSHSQDAIEAAPVYGKVFSNARLWKIAAVEGAQTPGNVVDDALRPITRFGLRGSAIAMVLSLALALVLGRVIKRHRLAFQCSNCGELTSESTCSSERGTFICENCTAAIANVSSEKVTEALLRQRRQSVLVRRRRAIKVVTMWLPGLRDIFYGRLARGVFLASLFALSLVQLWARGYIISDWNALSYPTPLWKWILPGVGIVLSYVLSLFSRQYLEVRNYRTPGIRARYSENQPAAGRASA